MILQIQKPKTTPKKFVLAQNTIIKKPTDAITSTISPTQTPTITPTLSLIPQFSPTPTPIPININNNPPSSGYTVQQVQTDAGVFNVNIVSADLNSTRVIVDTSSAVLRMGKRYQHR